MGVQIARLKYILANNYITGLVRMINIWQIIINPPNSQQESHKKNGDNHCKLFLNSFSTLGSQNQPWDHRIPQSLSRMGQP